jgi:hypothetical protein
MNYRIEIFNSQFLTLNSIISTPNDHRSRPNLLLLVPNGQGPNGHGALDVSPNGLESKPNPLSYVPSTRVSKRHLDRGVIHNIPPEVRVV